MGNGVDRLPIGLVGLLVVNAINFIGLLPSKDEAVGWGCRLSTRSYGEGAG